MTIEKLSQCFTKLCLNFMTFAAITSSVMIPAAAFWKQQNDGKDTHSSVGQTGLSDPSALAVIVDRHALALGVPTAFARAVIRVESDWNPRLTGAAGEVGLMQIKQETAEEMGFKGSREALYEPRTNVRWGMRYLAGAWRLGGGDLCQTVLRYQAGHNAKTMTNAATAYCAKVRRYMAELG